KRLIEQLPALNTDQLDLHVLADVMRDEDMRTAFRYLGAPPVSEDDLKTLAESSLAPTVLRERRTESERVRDTVLRIIDPHRFGWLTDRREPSHDERARAVIASAVLVAVRKVETSRRSNAKRFQENAVERLLAEAGFEEVEARDIPLLDAAPAPGQFCGESKLGGTRADIVARLYDGRVMPLECKVSNSAVNSFKRINHEAAGKARDWIAGFGQLQVVPAAVIAGVFNPPNLATAQHEGLTIYWNDRLDDLVEFIAATAD
ncbi:MAG: XamI family restriction endonuclease, partial [Gammaproteobacteria bacterium]|nr:XamI family restriction endonuclease [Gammaproteobacteria bacterium]